MWVIKKWLQRIKWFDQIRKGLGGRNSKAPVLDVTCTSYVLFEGLQSTVYCYGGVSSNENNSSNKNQQNAHFLH